MATFPATVMNEDLTELEKETIEAYAVRESIFIIEDELEYYFAHKQKLLEMLIAGINLNKITPEALAEKMNQALLSPQELEILLAKIQKRIMRELAKANCRSVFSLQATEISSDLPQFELDISEQLRTLKLSRTVVKAIDTAWKKAGKNVIPQAISKVSNRFSLGEYLVSTLAVGPKEHESVIASGCLKSARATLRQYQSELMSTLVRQVTKQLFKSTGNCIPATDEYALIMYA